MGIRYSIIGPYVSIDKGTTLEKSVVENSIIGANVRLRHSLLSGSIVSNNASFTGQMYKLNIGDSSQVMMSWEES